MGVFTADPIMHFHQLGKQIVRLAKRVNVGSEIQILLLNALRVALSDQMLVRW